MWQGGTASTTPGRGGKQFSQTVPSIMSLSSTMEGTQIIIKDVLPSSSALQSTFCPLAAWPSVPVVCGWLCRVSVVLLTHTRCHFPSPAGHTIAMLPFFSLFISLFTASLRKCCTSVSMCAKGCLQNSKSFPGPLEMSLPVWKESCWLFVKHHIDFKITLMAL